MAEVMKVVLRDITSTHQEAFPESYCCGIFSRIWMPVAYIRALKQPVDGHWLVMLYEGKQPEVIGVTSHEFRVGEKTYEKSREWGEKYAQARGFEFVDETIRGKASDLEADWDAAISEDVARHRK